MQSTTPATQTRYCHYTEEQVLNSGLLTPERCAEVKAAIDAAVEPVFDQGGAKLTCGAIATYGGIRHLHINQDDRMTTYMRKLILADVLTAEELEAVNRDCLKANAHKKDLERFEKAEKVTECDEGVFYEDLYFATLDELFDHFKCQGGEPPKYVWAAQGEPVISSLSVAEVVESDVSDRGWEDMETSDLNGIDELQKALDQFVEANRTVKSFHANYAKAVLLNPSET